MKPGTRSYGAASLQVAIPRALPPRMHARILELVHLFVPEESRRQGHATELLNRTIEEADRTRTVLFLCVEDPPLEAFYQRFKFRAIQRNPLLMARAPYKVTLAREPQ